jgi:glycosyltransferase involved in cell wall biosynthesis
MTLEAALIVKNEEAMLSRCLDSIKGVDLITVVDTGSEDGTVEIARKYTDKVFTDFKWIDHFGKARQHSKNKCAGDWIVTIDADEVLETPIEEVKRIVKEADKQGCVFVDLDVVAETGKGSNRFPRIYKNIPEVTWHGAAHNYLECKGGKSYQSKIRILYGYSPAHKKDPDRTLRILKAAVEQNPELVRERYYLAREYYYRDNWSECINHLGEYIKRSRFLSERNDAYLMRANCLSKLGKYNEACDSAWEAIKYNANFKEALLFIGNHMDATNKRAWLKYADLATNENVLFDRVGEEKGSEYYDELFSKSSDMSRYEELYEKIGELVGAHSALDIGCGTAELYNYIDNYQGFDFSEKTIKKLRKKRIPVRVGNAYDKENYTYADIYIATEVLEHLDDLKVIENIPKGSRFIFSVPSFGDPSHLRTYTQETVKSLPVDIKSITRFNWDGKWVEGGKETTAYILLVDSTKR